jgi:hypothetical protein
MHVLVYKLAVPYPLNSGCKKKKKRPSVLPWTAITDALEADSPHSVNLNEVALAQTPVRVN